MNGWRARLAVLKARDTDADSANSAERQAAPLAAGPIGAFDATGTGVEGVEQGRAGDAAAFYRQAAEEAAVALAAHDPDLAH